MPSKWTSSAHHSGAAEGRVALLGDSAHAMQPNLGQGGCMAIEDAYQLGKDLYEQADRARASATALEPEGVLQVCCPVHCWRATQDGRVTRLPA